MKTGGWRLEELHDTCRTVGIVIVKPAGSQKHVNHMLPRAVVHSERRRRRPQQIPVSSVWCQQARV